MDKQARLPRVDIAYLMRWSPLRWTWFGFVFFGFFYVTSPLVYEWDYFSWNAIAYMVACLIAFVGGCYATRWILGTGNLHPEDPNTRGAFPRSIGTSPDSMINVTAMLATVGVMARVYDRFVLRGFAIGSDTFEDARNSLASTISIFGYIGGATFCFGIVCLMLIWISASQRRRPKTYVLAILLAAYPSIEAVLQGSRSTVFYTVLLLMIFAYATATLQWLFRSKLLMALGAAVLFVAAQAIYEIRTLQMTDQNFDIADVYELAGIAQFVHPPDWITDILIATDGKGLLGGFIKVWTHFSQYLTHALLVYCANFEQFDGTLGYGQFHFFIPLRVLGAIIGEPYSYDPSWHGMESGLTATAFSGIQYDFGGLGPAVAGLFGAAVALIHHKVLEYPERWLPLYAYLSLAVFAIPIHTELLSAYGAFATWSFLLYIPLHYVIGMLLGEEDARPRAMPQADVPAPAIAPRAM
jgi:hypothetical protein